MITQSYLKDRLEYNPNTGIFTWINVHPKCRFPAGTIANSRRTKGIRIMIDRVSYQAHKLAVLYMTGTYPVDNVLHINGDYYDNRLVNLRLATPAQSCLKRGNNRNTSNVKGVNWSKSSGKWEARAMVDGKRKCLGVFDNISDAEIAYKEYMKPKYNFYEVTE